MRSIGLGVAIALLVALLLSACQPVMPEAASEEGPPPAMAAMFASPRHGLAKIGDITMYYEVHGEGEPLLLLHADTVAGIENWAYHAPILAQHYQVIVPDRRAHGRTTDTDQPLDYEVEADDMAALLDYLGIEKAHVVGFSGGGTVALALAIKHPDRVNRIVASGTSISPDGMTEEEKEFGRTLSPETYSPEMAAVNYLNIAPDPEHFREFLAKIGELGLTQPQFTPEELAAITTPIHLVDGEIEDSITTEHRLHMADVIPTADLVLYPGSGHLFPMEQPDVFLKAVFDFLAQGER